MALRKILVVGATGKQGGALINALLADSAPYEVLALTRDPSSPAAQALSSRPNVTIVKGDVSSPSSIFEAHRQIKSVFCVTSFVPGKVNTEEQQAIPLIDASIRNGVEHFVFSSVDRGGPGISERNPTEIPHFATKHRIEEYLKEKSAGTKTQWIILRPVGFMENFVPGFSGRVSISIWAYLGDKPMQLVSIHDIGVYLARIVVNMDVYKGRAISLAGDELTLQQGRKVFRDSLGTNMPWSLGPLGLVLIYCVADLRAMVRWFKEVGYGADIEELRNEEPRIQDFGTWLKEGSEFGKR